jgi:hypothetical protein
MAVFSTTLYLSQGTGNTNVPAPTLANMETIAQGTVAVPSSLAAADTINVGYLPRGAVVTGMTVSSTGIDTNNIVAIQIGDAALQTRLGTFSGTLLGTGGTSVTFPLTAWNYQYLAPTLVTASVSIAGTAKVAGTLFFQVWYTMAPLPS